MSSNYWTDAVAKEVAYDEGYSAGYATARDRIFEEIEKALKYSKTTHVGQQFYGMILEDYLADIKKTFGGNQHDETNS